MFESLAFLAILILGVLLADTRSRLKRTETSLVEAAKRIVALQRHTGLSTPDETLPQAAPPPPARTAAPVASPRPSRPARAAALISVKVPAMTEEAPKAPEPSAREGTTSEASARKTAAEPANLSARFENLFGKTLPIWAGGITLAIAGVLIVRYAIDLGFFARVFTPGVQVIAGILFGLGLIGGAEYAWRNEARLRDVRVPQALSGAGIATLYAAIIVAANSDVQRMLGELIRQLDSRRQQVIVEAIVVEIGDDAAKRLGVQFLLGGKNIPFVATNYSNAQPNIFTLGGAYAANRLSQETTTVNGNTTVTQTNSALGSSLQEAAAASLLQATGGFAGFAGDIGKNTIFGAIINAVKSDTTSNLLATPHIVTLDNQAAKFLVGQDVPITTGEKLGTNFENAFRTVQREEVGIKLEVTPQVNGAGEVKMFLRQEVSSVAGPVSSRNSDLILNKRSFETVLTVDDGEILAIGGLLNDDERKTIERIPLLSDIPLLGELFKSRSRTRSKTNLMVFIRPTILRNREDNAALTARRYGYIRDFQLQRNPDEEPAIDALVRDYLGAVPPVPTEATAADVTVGPINLPELRGPDGKVISTDVPPSVSQAPAPPPGDYP
ncbi:MAG: DUF2339 domain-containing protein [Sphingopyxis sp.]|nr:DUF2339 domain-containing protein [Sphingopyxis sp.]